MCNNLLGDKVKRKELIKVIEEFVRCVMGDDDAHGYPHVERVRKLALWLSKFYEVDEEVIEIAVLLHDIGRLCGGDEHAHESAILARRLLEVLNYPKDKLEKVIEAIEAHSYTSGVEPKSLEAKIVSDADKLDALGSIGIARVFLYSCHIGRSIKDSLEHFKEKILNLPKVMYTEVGRKEALRRVKIVREFVEQLENELKFYT